MQGKDVHSFMYKIKLKPRWKKSQNEQVKLIKIAMTISKFYMTSDNYNYKGASYFVG